MKRNIKFHKMGTSNESQLRKLDLFKDVKSFWCEKYGSDIYVYEDNSDRVIGRFSKSTFRQFILVWKSFGILEQTNTNYVFLTKNILLSDITNHILTPSSDPKIQVYKDSRIICFLISINYINNENLHLFNFRRINTKKNQNKIFKSIKEFSGEISWWEKEVSKEKINLFVVLERIENEWK